MDEARRYVDELKKENPNFEYLIRNSNETRKGTGGGWWGCGF